jgi:hypothetical protein
MDDQATNRESRRRMFSWLGNLLLICSIGMLVFMIFRMKERNWEAATLLSALAVAFSIGSILLFLHNKKN